jgi:hypothetical protein
MDRVQQPQQFWMPPAAQLFKKFRNILWNPRGSLPRVYILSQINLLHTPSYFSNIHLNIILLTYVQAFLVVSSILAFPPSLKYHLPRVAVVEKTRTVTLLTHVSRYSSAVVSVTSHFNNLIRRLSQLWRGRTSLLESKKEVLAFSTANISELFLGGFKRRTNRYETLSDSHEALCLMGLVIPLTLTQFLFKITHYMHF